MNDNTSTSLRVRFALALGWHWQSNGAKHRYLAEIKKDMADLEWPLCGDYDEGTPDPTDANTIREALMRMTEEEWERFVKLLWVKAPAYPSVRYSTYEIVSFTLKTPPTTLAEIYCEVKFS